ncbi:hypothetical protein L3V82_05465 [Thiotrichales bacterium 19S3-7]|nr:hypothetical protein [Thiotrichales bacterium 19S3-7]MCF6801542.1 hypothetical protein [Thiotrichales bacterium 19S3-11]
MNIYNTKELVKTYIQNKSKPQKHKSIVNNRFNHIIHHTWNKSLFYRDYWKMHGISEKDLNELTVKDLPYVDKTLLMENFDIAVTDTKIKKAHLANWIDNNKNYDELYLNKYHIVHTSGTSGEQGIFPWSKASWSKAWAASVTRALKPKLRAGITRCAVILAAEGRFCGAGFSRSGDNSFFEVKLYCVSESIEKIAHQLEIYQPHQLGGYALIIGDLARMQLAGKLNIKPERIFTSGEPLFENDANVIEKAWHIRATNLYMASEGLLIGAQQQHSTFDIFDDLNILSTTNNDQTTTNIGNICITNLSNHVLPIINYKMEDLGSLTPAGVFEKYPKLELSDCRLNHAVEIINNHGQADTIHPSLFEEFYVADMISFQFVIQNNQIKIYYTSEEDISNHVESNFYDILKVKEADTSVGVKAQRVEQLSREAKGEKFQLINVVN